VNNTDSPILSRTVSKLLRIIGGIFAIDRWWVPFFSALVRSEPLNSRLRNFVSRK